ncbi:MAG: hypothetical protein R3E08_02770 [Thiotrichaceae bacterium]
MLFATFLLFFAVQGAVQAEGVSKEIKFKSGHSSSVEKGCVVGADTDEYTLEAHQGQTMSVSIESEEDNAVFNMFYWADGVLEPVEGTGDQEEGSAVKHWKGKLPGNADETTQYKIEVGKERGNACYTLKVTIK